MSRPAEKTILGLDNTGSYWIIHLYRDNTSSIFVINKTGPNVDVGELFGTQCDILHSEILQELEARRFEGGRYINDFQTFQATCDIICDNRLGGETPPDQEDFKKRDWIIKDIDVANTVLDTKTLLESSKKLASMSKRPRDDLAESSFRSERRQPDKNAPALGRGDTYRPYYDDHRPNALSSARTKQSAEYSALRNPSISPGQDMHNSGVNTSKYDDRLDKPRRPMQQLRQMNSVAGVSPPRPHEVSSTAPKKIGGDHQTQHHASSGGMSNGFSGVPRGPKLQSRPRQPQALADQRATYERALEDKISGVVPYEELARLKERPHIFISSSYLPFMPQTITHLRKFFSKKDIRDVSVKAEASGYYLSFPDDAYGRDQLQQCYERANDSIFFNVYILHMDLRIDGEVPPKRLSNNDERGGQKLGESLGRPENRFESLPLPVDGPSTSHLRMKADDEISITPSEISSATTRAKTHCAECKSNHFPSYNPKFACKTCPRHYHAKCRKPHPRLSEDSATWQCNYCIKKGRPITDPAQQKAQAGNSGRMIFMPASLQNGTQRSGVQPVGQRNVDEAAQATQSGEPEQGTGKSSNFQGKILDPRLRNRAGGPNGSAAPPELHKHSPGTRPTQEHKRNVNTQGVTEFLRNMQPRHDGQVDLEGLSPKRHEQHPTANAEGAKLIFGPHVGVPISKAPDGSAAFEKTKITRPSSEDDANHAVPWVSNQADLSPEIPDLSLDIDEASLGERQETATDKAAPVVSNGSHEPVKCGPELPRSQQGKKPTSRPRCSMCGKPLFSAGGKAADATCARCKKEQQVVGEDGSLVARSPRTAEEVWRLRLQPEKARENGLASPTDATSQDPKAPQPRSEPSLSKQSPEQPTAEIGEQPERADGSPSSQSIAETEVDDGGEGEETFDDSESTLESLTSAAMVEVEVEENVDGTHGEEAAETGPLTTSRGPSVEANELGRRSCSPVNKNINNDDAAGMESDNAHSATGSEGARHSRSSAVSGVRPNVGRKVAHVAEPTIKLPGSFSWPDLIGFALAEASDHRMTAAQVHQWIADNVANYNINNSTQRSSIAATLSQQKVKFPKTEPIIEGSRQLCRWKLAPDWVLGFKDGLEAERAKLRKTSSQAGLTLRRKELNDAPKAARGAPSTSAPKPAPLQKESSKTSIHTEETPMFIKRHRVAYDADGRDIVAGFKDIPIEKWTRLAEVESFRKHGLRLFIGDYIKAPLPNRFRFADYTHKPLVQTIAQIEEIRQRRDGPGYAVLVQWFLTKEAAEWWKCRLVKSLWPKDEKAGIYVPATIWDILTSDFVAEQEKLDAEEAKRQIVPDLFFDLDTDKSRLYLKEGRGPETGIAFGPRATDEKPNGTEDTACGLNRPEERTSALPRHIEHLPKRTKFTVEMGDTSEQPSPPKSLGLVHHVSPRKTGPSPLGEARHTGFFTRVSPVRDEQEPPESVDLERQLFTPSPANAPAVEAADVHESRPEIQRTPTPTPTIEPPVKRQKTKMTYEEEQEAIRAILQKEQENAKYDVKDLWAAAPEYDPANDLWDREAKIAEIKARPSRKARFTQNLAYARRDRPPNALYMEVNRPLPKAYKAPYANRPGSGHSGNSTSHTAKESRADSARSNLGDADDIWNSELNDDTDMPDAQTQATTTTSTTATEWTPAGAGEASNDETDTDKPEMFDTLEELLGLPANVVPTLYDGRLAFRDGTMGLDGRMPRAKKIFKVGRNVPGELK